MAKKLHKVDVDVKLLRSSQGSSGHGEFLIQEKNKVKTQADTTTNDVDLIFSSNGSSISQRRKLYQKNLWEPFFFLLQNRKSHLNSSVELSRFTFFSIETCPSSKWVIPSRGSCPSASIDPTARSPIYCEWYAQHDWQLVSRKREVMWFFKETQSHRQMTRTCW